MPKVRGGLPDHPVRLSVSVLRTHLVAPDVFAALSKSALYLQRTEFDAWYEKQKRRRRGPSQRTSKKRQKKRKEPPGRPTKITNELLTSIKALVAQGKWSAPDGIAKLARLLASNGAPLRNTLRRAVDQLYLEIGDTRYRVVPRKRSKAKSAKPANLVSVRRHPESDESVIQGRRSDFEGAPMWTKENRGRYDRSRLRYRSDLTDEEWAITAARRWLREATRIEGPWRLNFKRHASRFSRNSKAGSSFQIGVSRGRRIALAS
jgi:hypothetical protein